MDGERLARIETKVDGIREDFAKFIEEQSESQKSAERTKDRVLVLERDKWWLFTLSGFAFASAVAMLVERYKT